MKLLIVDDETLTRDGLCKAIHWLSLGITEVQQAADGESAISICKEFKPHIVLCDIRMPRMDGIEFGKTLEHMLPETALVFMSGYSDKAYLKAAIHLKVVNYIEKPLDLQEVQDAIVEAKEQVLSRQNNKRIAGLYLDVAEIRLANILTHPMKLPQRELEALALDAKIHQSSQCYVTAYVINARLPQGKSLRQEFLSVIKHHQLQGLSTTVGEALHVYFILESKLLQEEQKRLLQENLVSLFTQWGDVVIGTAAATKPGIESGYHTYEIASRMTTIGFFFPQGTVVSEAFLNSYTLGLQQPEHMGLETYGQHLSHGKKAETFRYLSTLLEEFFMNPKGRREVVIDRYYRHMVVLREAATKAGINATQLFHPRDVPILEQLKSCILVTAAHRLLVNKTEEFFELCTECSLETPVITLIKGYIGTNYSNSTLSVRDVANFANLSVSYLCTVFKNQTGTTITAYLTNYRMEQAKNLLTDGRNRVSDVSLKVGYHDCNYFGKTFRKFTGFTPSQYREQVLP